jgi:hypothetical protein
MALSVGNRPSVLTRPTPADFRPAVMPVARPGSGDRLSLSSPGVKAGGGSEPASPLAAFEAKVSAFFSQALNTVKGWWTKLLGVLHLGPKT